MRNRKPFFQLLIFCVFAAAFPVRAQSEPSAVLEEFAAEEEESILKISCGKLAFSYLSFPMSAAAGIFSAVNDFSSFVKAGVSYDFADSAVLNCFAGADFNFRSYILSASVQYNLLDNAFDFSTFGNKTYSADISFSFPVALGRISVPFSFGRKPFSSGNSAVPGQNPKERFMYLNCKPSFDFLLFDNGFVKVDGKVSDSITYLYSENFVFDELEVSLNSVFFARYFDFAFGLEYFNSFEIHREDTAVDITRRLDRFTRRIKLGAESGSTASYSDIFMLENENRFYFLRLFNSASNLFVSTFGNIGVGFLENRTDFLWSLGAGIGYSLFSTVPFTIQFGVDSGFSPILSVFVVSSF